MITKSFNIANGVKLHYIETDKFKTNYFSFNFLARKSNENVHFNAMIPLILMRACQKYPSQALINKRLQYLYSGDICSRNDSFGEYQIFGLRVNMLNDRYTVGTDVTGDMVDLVCEMLFNPYLVNGVFDEEFTRGEKINLMDTIDAEANNKGQYSIKRLMSEMCKDEVFGISKMGEVDDVQKITAESLYNAYVEALESDPIEIYFVGKTDISRVVDAFKSRFESINRAPKEIAPVEIKMSATEVKQVVDTEKVNQGKLALGFRTGYHYSQNEYHLVQLFNEIFGGSPTAKLFTNVREKMSLCYFCRSIINQRNGIMIVSSGIESKNKEIAEKAILEQLEAIKNGDVSDEEFISAKKSIRNGYLSIYDGAEAMEAWAFFRGLCGIDTTPLAESEKIEKVTLKEIKEVAKKMTLDTVYFLKGEDA